MQSSDPHRHDVWRLRKEETIWGTNPTAADPHTREAFQLCIYMECIHAHGRCEAFESFDGPAFSPSTNEDRPKTDEVIQSMNQSIASWGHSSATRVTLAAKNKHKSKSSDGTISVDHLVMLKEHEVDNDTTSTNNNRQNSHNFMQQSCNVTEATKNNIRWRWKVRSGDAKVRRRLLCRKFIRRITHVNLIRIGQHAGVRYRSSCKGRGRAHFQSNTPGTRYRRKQHFKLIQDLQRGLLAYELTARSFWADNCLDVLRQIRQEQFGRRQWSKVLQELLYTTRSTKLPMQSRIRHLQHMRKSKPTFYVDLSEFYQTLPPARLQRSIKVRL